MSTIHYPPSSFPRAPPCPSRPSPIPLLFLVPFVLDMNFTTSHLASFARIGVAVTAAFFGVWLSHDPLGMTVVIAVKF